MERKWTGHWTVYASRKCCAQPHPPLYPGGITDEEKNTPSLPRLQTSAAVIRRFQSSRLFFRHIKSGSAIFAGPPAARPPRLIRGRGQRNRRLKIDRRGVLHNSSAGGCCQSSGSMQKPPGSAETLLARHQIVNKRGREQHAHRAQHGRNSSAASVFRQHPPMFRSMNHGAC